MLQHNLLSNNILANEQLGFHDNFSTGSAIFKLIKSVTCSWDNNEHTTGLFRDLNKAFVSDGHGMLILIFGNLYSKRPLF